jgi:hypothetical protein
MEKFAPGVNYTGGLASTKPAVNFATSIAGVNITGSKFAAGVNNPHLSYHT